MRQKCACGCGKLAKEGNRYIHGHNLKGKIFSEETRKKMSIARTGTHPSPETRRKLSIARTGTHHSAESREKISIAKTGRKFSLESRRKMSIAKTGKNHPMWEKHPSLKTRRKMSIARTGKNNHNFGKKFSVKTLRRMSIAHTNPSAETRRKMSIAKTGTHPSAETRQKMSMAVTPERKQALALHCIEMLRKNAIPTKVEKEKIKLIKKHKLPWKFVGDGREKDFFGKVPDFVCTNGTKAFAEVYEDYWKIKDYGSVARYKRTRRAHFKKFGYKTIFIHAYNDSDEEVIKKLNEVEGDIK